MFNKLKSLGKDSGIYIISQLTLSALGIFLLPLFSYYLSPTEYAIYSLILTVNNIFVIFILLGLHASLASTYFDYKDVPLKLKKHISSLFYFLLVWGTILSIGVYILSISLLTTDYTLYLSSILSISISSAINQFYGSFLRCRKKSIQYSFFSNGNSILVIISTVILLTLFDLGIYSPLYSLVFFNTLFSLYAIYSLINRRFIGFYFSLKDTIHSLKFSLPFIPHLLSSIINSSLDKIILLKYVSISSMGIYAMGSQIGGLINIIFTGINMAWTPYFQEIYRKNHNKDKDFIANASTYIILIVSFCIFVLSLFAKELVYFFLSKEYIESYTIIPIIALSFFFLMFYSLLSGALFAEKKSGKIASSTMFGAFINIILNFTLIPYFGLYGAAIATLISWMIVSVVIYYHSRKYYKFPFQKKRLFKIVSLFLIFFGLSYIPLFEDILYVMIYKLLLVIISLLGLYVTGTLNKKELQIIKNTIQRKKR